MRAVPTVALLLAAGLLAGCTAPAEDRAPAVVATFYPLAFLASRIAEPDLAVTSLVPPGTEPHDWEPSPRDILRAESARVFLFNGAGLEPWAEELAERLAKDGRIVVEASRGMDLLAASESEHDEEEHAEGEEGAGHDAGNATAQEAGNATEEGHETGEHGSDPHVWLDPVRFATMAERVRDGVLRADPGNGSAHGLRTDALLADLQGLHLRYAEGLEHCANRNILTAHTAFSYLAKRYGFTQWGISGVDPESEPTPAKLAEAVELARRLNVTHVFFETLVSPRVAQVIAQEVGAQTLVLNPIEGLTAEDRAAGKDYLRLMEDNLANLRIAMRCT